MRCSCMETGSRKSGRRFPKKTPAKQSLFPLWQVSCKPLGWFIQIIAGNISTTVGDWLVVWTPLKNISQLGWLFPIYGKIKHVPNHQPGEYELPGIDFIRLMFLARVYSRLVNCFSKRIRHSGSFQTFPAPRQRRGKLDSRSSFTIKGLFMSFPFVPTFTPCKGPCGHAHQVGLQA